MFTQTAVHCTKCTLQYSLRQACRNPGILDYRIPARFHFFIYSWSCDKIVCKYDQNCLQISHRAGVLDSSTPGFLHACCTLCTADLCNLYTVQASAAVCVQNVIRNLNNMKGNDKLTIIQTGMGTQVLSSYLCIKHHFTDI